MALNSYSAKAPGSMMFFGEHAVLHQKQAIVFAIDKYIKVSLKVRTDKKITIHSALGNYEQELSSISVEKPFKFVLAAVLFFKDQITEGFDLFIDSEFAEDLGLGSSAAVTVATVAVLSEWLNYFPLHQDRFLNNFLIAKSIIQSVQGIGSGADVAASVYGGVLVYQNSEPFIITKLMIGLPLSVIYSGSKTPTPEVISIVNSAAQKYPEIYSSLYEAIDKCVKSAIPLIEIEAWQPLGELMNIQQELMNALGVGTPLLNKIVEFLKADPGIYGAKISGSGLGDCVVALGQRQQKTFGNSTIVGIKELEVGVSGKGVAYG